jgi:hypothetical protein
LTLSPEQWDKIYAGLPKTLGGTTIAVHRTRQFVNLPDFPIVLITPVTEGIPVSDVRQLWEHYNESLGMMEVKFGQQCKARISACVEASGMTEARTLASLFSTALFSDELSVNPIQDRMQFRGADPPENLAPYTVGGKTYIHRFNIDFFVEYEFSWIKPYPVVREVLVELQEDQPVYLTPTRIQHGLSYLLDVIILEAEEESESGDES